MRAIKRRRSINFQIILHFLIRYNDYLLSNNEDVATEEVFLQLSTSKIKGISTFLKETTAFLSKTFSAIRI